MRSGEFAAHPGACISVIVPVYNAEKHLVRCLDSIREQTFEDYEVILVDDGSCDKSGEICATYLSDSRFCYIRQKNSGVSVARNVGLERAQGDWIAFIDSDDYIASDYLEPTRH